MRVRLLSTARREAMRAADWYDSRMPGLDDRFLDDLAQGMRRLRDHPTATPVLAGGLRRELLHVYPYKSVFRVEPDEVLVIAVAHHKRKPGYWKRRLKRSL